MVKTLFSKPKVADGFPLSWHKGAGQWYKKFHGKFIYFGSESNTAVERYLKEKDYHIAGVPIPNCTALTVRQLCNQFLAAKDARRGTGELSERTYTELLSMCKLLASHFGERAVFTLQPMDFERYRTKIATKSPVVLKNRMIRVRSVFKYAADNHMIDRPVDFGSSFALPEKANLRKHRAKQQAPIFSVAEINLFMNGRVDPDDGETFLRGADEYLKAWMLLGINCGLYAVDISGLLHRHIEGEFLEYARAKTGICRRSWLWPETREAIANVATNSKLHRNVFLTSRDRTLIIETHGEQRIDAVASRFASLKIRLKYKREAAGFKNLRHTYRTVVDEAGDQPAILLTMGHADSGISDYYRHGIADSRLIAASQYVRTWLFGK